MSSDDRSARIEAQAGPGASQPQRPKANVDWHGGPLKYALLGAAASVVIVTLIGLLDLGDNYDENGVRPSLLGSPTFWVLGELLVSVQVVVLARAVHARSVVWSAVAVAALGFALWQIWGFAAH